MLAETPHRLLKEKQRQERVELILQAAEEVFAEKGYHDTSMDEIAARVGVAKGTLYQHFSSKEELVFAICEQDLEALQRMVERIAISALPAREKLEQILRHMYPELRKRMQLLRSLFMAMDVRKGLIEKRLQMRDRLHELAASIKAVLEQGKAEGSFDRAIPTVVMLTAFFSLLAPQGFERLLVEEQLSSEEQVSYIGRIYFTGIATRE